MLYYPDMAEPVDPKKADLQKQLERTQELKREQLEKEKERQMGRRQETKERGERQHAFAEADILAQERKKRELKEWKAAEVDRKKAVIEMKKKKEEEKKFWEDQAATREKRMEKRRAYMKQMREQNARQILKEHRKTSAKKLMDDTREKAEWDAMRGRQQAEVWAKQEKNKTETQGRKKRAEADQEEQRLKETADEEARQKKAKLDMQEREALSRVDGNMRRLHMEAGSLPVGLREAELRKIDLDERREREKIAQDKHIRQTAIDTETNKRKLEIEALARRKRDDAMIRERGNLQKIEQEERQRSSQAGKDAVLKEEEAARRADRIARGEEEIPI